jgi:hypothetical protein
MTNEDLFVDRYWSSILINIVAYRPLKMWLSSSEIYSAWKSTSNALKLGQFRPWTT